MESKLLPEIVQLGSNTDDLSNDVNSGLNSTERLVAVMRSVSEVSTSGDISVSSESSESDSSDSSDSSSSSTSDSEGTENEVTLTTRENGDALRENSYQHADITTYDNLYRNKVKYVKEVIRTHA